MNEINEKLNIDKKKKKTRVQSLSCTSCKDERSHYKETNSEIRLRDLNDFSDVANMPSIKSTGKDIDGLDNIYWTDVYLILAELNFNEIF